MCRNGATCISVGCCFSKLENRDKGLSCEHFRWGFFYVQECSIPQPGDTRLGSAMVVRYGIGDGVHH